MRAVLQRVAWARVLVDGDIVGEIEGGLVVLVGITHSDTDLLAARLSQKVWEVRILDGEQSASDLDAPLLVVSQFTLYGDTRRGRRPSWSAAAPGLVAEPLVEAFVAALRAGGATVETGVFGADMVLELANTGPMTLWLEV